MGGLGHEREWKKTRTGNGSVFEMGRRQTLTSFLCFLWWGYWQADGKRHDVSICRCTGFLHPKGRGNTPRATMVFERSREVPKAQFKELTSRERSEADRTVLVSIIHAARYGSKVERVKIADMWTR